MAKIVVLLEDDERRAAAMAARLRDRFPAYSVRVWSNSRELCEALPEIWDDVALISLDHDLAVESGDDGRLVDQGDGLEVAEHLARRDPTFPVLLHSTNGDAVERMDRLLRKRGWETARVTPFNDLEWIHQAWWPAARRFLVHAPGEDLRLRSAGVFPYRVSELVRRLIAAGDAAELAAAEERLLRRWVRYVLMRTPRLIAYVDWLRGEVSPFPHLELPAPAVADAVITGGARRLERGGLARLALNPVALFYFHDRIREERPPAWRSPKVPEPPLVIRLWVGEAMQMLATGGDASGYRVFHSDLELPWAGRTYRGKLRWNWKAEGGQDESYLRVELEGLRENSLAARLKAPTVIVRSPAPPKVEAVGPPPWREEIPLVWDRAGGALVSAWRLVRVAPGPVELELTTKPTSSAEAAVGPTGSRYDDPPLLSRLQRQAGRPRAAADSA